MAGNKADFAGTNGSGTFLPLSNAQYAPGTSVYFSYLMRITSDSGYAGVSLFQGSTETLFTGNLSNGGNFFGIDPKSGASALSNVSAAKLSLVVCRVDFAATEATINLYLNPTSGVEPATPDLVVKRTAALTYDRIRIQSSGATGSIDELRLGTTFADVAPVTYGNNTQEVVVLGSSVAAGVGADNASLSWASRLGTLLEKQAPVAPGSNVTWQIANASISGNNTSAVINRYQTDVAVAHQDADIVIVGLSMANEGLVGSTNPQPVFDSFKNGLTQIAAKIRAQGAYPMFTIVYPQNAYTADQYEYVKRMNLLLNTWNSPSVNFLGAIDDGSGHWAAGNFFDDGHPNSTGHGELFYSIVPTLFDAIVSGRTESPQWKETPGYLRLQRDEAQTSPVSFTPAHPMHSYTLAFRLRTTDTGTVAAVSAGSNRATLEVRSGSLVYIGPTGEETNTGVVVNDGAWHDIALSHRYATNRSLIYVDGVLKGSVGNTILPDRFTLGGAATSARAASPAQADYQDLAIYRAAWTAAEATAQSSGAMQQSSMEICAPLADSAPAQGASLENRAQSLSQVVLNTGSFSAQVAANAPTNLKAESFVSGTAILTWTGHGGSGFIVERRPSGVSTAWTTVATLSSAVNAYEDGALTPATSYDYRVTAVEGSLRSDAAGVSTVAPGGQAAHSYQDWISGYFPDDRSTYLVDFNPSATGDYGGVKWNTVTSPAAGAAITLADTANRTTAGITVAVTDGFDQTRTDNGAPLTGYAAAAQASQFALRDDVPLTGAIRFSGLNPASTYDFTFFARRGAPVAGYHYNGTYTFTGSGVPVAVTVNGNQNTALTTVTGITPTATGTVTLTLSAAAGTGTPFVVINFLQLSESGQNPAYLAKIDPNGDPDGDGVSNFEEFIRNLNPATADAKPFGVKDFTAGATVRLQVVKNRRASGVSYLLEKSGDLTTWVTDTAATSTLLERAGEFDTMAFDSQADGQAQFYRIRATGN